MESRQKTQRRPSFPFTAIEFRMAAGQLRIRVAHLLPYGDDNR